MKLEEQVCSLELAKKLKELGAKQESAFYFETIVNEEGDRSVTNLRFGKFFDDAANNRHVSYIAAFTVAELLELFPGEVEDSPFQIIMYDGWCVQYGLYGSVPDGSFSPDHFKQNSKLTDAVAEMLIHLIEKGIVKP